MNNPKSSKGSALVETSILMTVMLPVIFGTAMVGKIIDLKQTAEQAGRYAAWEATVYPQSGPNNAAPTAIADRFFGQSSTAIQTHAIEAGSHRLWGELDKLEREGLAAETQVQILSNSVIASYERDISEPSVAMSIGQQAGRAGEFLDGLSGNSWGLSSDGLLRAEVGVAIQGNSWLASTQQGCASGETFACLQSASVILADGWSASGDVQAKRRVRSLMPASALQPLGDVVSLVGHLPMFKELKDLRGAFGHVDMSVLPEYAKP